MNKFQLGQTLEDIITGFKGVATTRVTYMNGCVQYQVVPKMGKDGAIPKPQHLDTQQLKVVNNAKPVEAVPLNELYSDLEFGEAIKCKITGFKGRAIYKVESIDGSICYGCKPKAKDPSIMPKAIMIDQAVMQRLAAKKKKVVSKPTGGDHPDAPDLG